MLGLSLKATLGPPHSALTPASRTHRARGLPEVPSEQATISPAPPPSPHPQRDCLLCLPLPHFGVCLPLASLTVWWPVVTSYLSTDTAASQEALLAQGSGISKGQTLQSLCRPKRGHSGLRTRSTLGRRHWPAALGMQTATPRATASMRGCGGSQAEMPHCSLPKSDLLFPSGLWLL